MKALVRTEYGPADVLELRDVPKPIPAADEVLIRVHAASINGADRENLVGSPAYARLGGLRAPRYPVLGSDIAGRVEAVGRDVREFQVGDDVFGETPGYRGGFAEYACAPERLLVRKPSSLTFEEAAAIPQAGSIAYQGIVARGRVKPGQRVLINGAGGGAGSFAVQLARMCEAEVTAVDRADKLAFLTGLGADHVLDYAGDDLAKRTAEYDLILDVIATRSPLAIARALAPGGRYFYVGGSVSSLMQVLLLGRLLRLARGVHVSLLNVPQGRADVRSITELCETHRIRPAIDRVFPLGQGREAFRYVMDGRQKGKVVLTLIGPDESSFDEAAGALTAPGEDTRERQ